MPGRTSLKEDTQTVTQVIKKVALVAQPDSTLLRKVIDSIPPTTKYVLIGEASHGTEEFYRMRSEITKALITERNFNAVAAEADFPDAFRANLYCRNLNEDTSPEAALSDFIRFPTFMWRNTAVRDFIRWLREYNDTMPGSGGDPRKVGIYGLDVYSMHTSAKHVIDFLLSVGDEDGARRAKARYHCFDKYGEDSAAYGLATAFSKKSSCEKECLLVLKEVIEKHAMHAEVINGETGREMAFQAVCNAAVVAGAESYYRNMYFGEELTWNLRDTHFASTVERIIQHLAPRLASTSTSTSTSAGSPEQPKLVLWAHNSHLGDARATDMGIRRGEINLGQLMRERYGTEDVFNIGFTTHAGTVAAADEWNAPGQRKVVRKSMPQSYEDVFHRVGIPQFALNFRGGTGGGGDNEVQWSEMRRMLKGPMLERAIGVIYRPQTERQSHYFYSNITDQFDMVIHIDHTHAVQPLEPAHPSWEEEHLAKEDQPETYPFGI